MAARAFAEADAKLILMARTEDLLHEVRASCKNPEQHQVIPIDLVHIDRWNYSVQNVDIVLHCAGGGFGLRNPCVSAQAFYTLFMVNLGGAAEINKRVIPTMQARGSGRIIHVCSIASGEAIGSVGYNTIKAALGAYVRSLGRELAASGVVVTGISPGGFQAPGNSMQRLEATNPEAYREFIEKRLPRGVMGKAEEVVALLKFLASDEASMMGGCVVPIDAGEGHYY